MLLITSNIGSICENTKNIKPWVNTIKTEIEKLKNLKMAVINFQEIGGCEYSEVILGKKKKKGKME
jgi:hypothetical protein